MGDRHEKRTITGERYPKVAIYGAPGSSIGALGRFATPPDLHFWSGPPVYLAVVAADRLTCAQWSCRPSVARHLASATWSRWWAAS